MHEPGGSRFDGHVEALSVALDHADCEEPFRRYTMGSLLPLTHRRVEPMAARVDPVRVSAAHQSLHHFVAKAGLLAAVRDQVLPKDGTIEAWIVDDTGFPKKGKRSVGIDGQYCGQLGRQDNYQTVACLSVASGAAGLPIASICRRNGSKILNGGRGWVCWRISVFGLNR